MAVPNDPVIDGLVAKAANNSSHAIAQLQKGKITIKTMPHQQTRHPLADP